MAIGDLIIHDHLKSQTDFDLTKHNRLSKKKPPKGLSTEKLPEGTASLRGCCPMGTSHPISWDQALLGFQSPKPARCGAATVKSYVAGAGTHDFFDPRSKSQ